MCRLRMSLRAQEFTLSPVYLWHRWFSFNSRKFCEPRRGDRITQEGKKVRNSSWVKTRLRPSRSRTQLNRLSTRIRLRNSPLTGWAHACWPAFVVGKVSVANVACVSPTLGSASSIPKSDRGDYTWQFDLNF